MSKAQWWNGDGRGGKQKEMKAQDCRCSRWNPDFTSRMPCGIAVHGTCIAMCASKTLAAFRVPIFTKLTRAQQQYVQICRTEFHTTRKYVNVGNMDSTSCPLWLSLRQFSCNSSRNQFLWTSVPNFVQVGCKMQRIQA